MRKVIMMFAAGAILIVLFSPLPLHVQADEMAGTSERTYEPKTVSIYLKKIYLDGRVTVAVKQETIFSMEDFWARYRGWKIVDQNREEIMFVKEVNDISPLLKESGYFGLSNENILKIYNGKPDRNNVIHSFFQIDVRKLESRLKQRLKKGIPVKSKERYRTMLQRLSQ